MVRNRRSTVGLQFTRRWARTEYVTPRADEAELYRAVGSLVRRHLQRRAPEKKIAGDAEPKPRAGRMKPSDPLERMALLSLQMALGSSRQAAAATLCRLAEREGLPAELRQELAELAAACHAQPASSKLA